MADPSTFPEEHVGEPLVYRRISGFAIAGLITGGCYAVIVALACVSGLREGTPVLLPPWLQAIAVLGVGLAVAALVHISLSEGTVAGSKLAVWGLLLSVFFGLGYGSYYVATYFAIRQQANNFARRWFTRLEEGKINQAFLDAQDPASRQHVNHDDEDAVNARFPAGMARSMAAKTPLEAFRDNEVVRLLGQGGTASQITPLGVKDWEYARGGYRVQRTYQIETQEGVFEVEVTAMGSTSRTREYEGREWQIIMGGTRMQNAQLSDLAKEIGGLREQSNFFLEAWGSNLAAGQLEAVYLYTREPAERSRFFAEFRRRAIVAVVNAVGVAALNPLTMLGPLIRAGNPDTELADHAADFDRKNILQMEKLRAADVDTKEQVSSALKALFAPPRTGRPQLSNFKPSSVSVYRTWKINGDRIQLPHDCKFTIETSEGKRLFADTTIIVESDPGPITASRRPNWRISSVEVRHGEDRARMPPMAGQAAF